MLDILFLYTIVNISRENKCYTICSVDLLDIQKKQQPKTKTLDSTKKNRVILFNEIHIYDTDKTNFKNHMTSTEMNQI